jgi:hypothetical protein
MPPPPSGAVISYGPRRAPGVNGMCALLQYAVARDGRFLMNIVADDAVTSPITIVQNWTVGLKK